jgi:hypothetical protein
MQVSESMSEVVNGKRYSVKGATQIAGDDYWDGHNFERSGQNNFLYRTRAGNYFAVHLTCWQGQTDTIEPLSLEEAQDLFESLREHSVEYEEAFPDTVVPLA